MGAKILIVIAIFFSFWGKIAPGSPPWIRLCFFSIISTTKRIFCLFGAPFYFLVPMYCLLLFFRPYIILYICTNFAPQSVYTCSMVCALRFSVIGKMQAL